MEDLILKPEDLAIVSALHLTDEDLDVPMPYDRDIYLFGTEIAGTRYAENIQELYDSLAEGDRVSLVREPENPYDEYAIRVETEEHAPIGYIPVKELEEPDETKLGYIPRINNRIIARLMDAGKFLYAVVRRKEMIGEHHKIVIKIYMKD